MSYKKISVLSTSDTFTNFEERDPESNKSQACAILREQVTPYYTADRDWAKNFIQASKSGTVYFSKRNSKHTCDDRIIIGLDAKVLCFLLGKPSRVLYTLVMKNHKMWMTLRKFQRFLFKKGFYYLRFYGVISKSRTRQHQNKRLLSLPEAFLLSLLPIRNCKTRLICPKQT